jgi:heme-degrading monooxygenase HmoA
MIVEYTRYKITEDQSSALEAAYEQAQSALQVSPHCLSYELSRCTEDPTMYILRIEWDSIEGHLNGFRKSQEFKALFEAVGPFFNNIQEMRHYAVTSVRGRSA